MRPLYTRTGDSALVFFSLLLPGLVKGKEEKEERERERERLMIAGSTVFSDPRYWRHEKLMSYMGGDCLLRLRTGNCIINEFY